MKKKLFLIFLSAAILLISNMSANASTASISKYRYSFVFLRNNSHIIMGSTTKSPSPGIIYVRSAHFWATSYINRRIGYVTRRANNSTLVTRSIAYDVREGTFTANGVHKWYRDGAWITRTTRSSIMI